MDEQFLIKFDSVTGERKETYPIDIDITEERMEELLSEGFEVVSRQDWELLVGNVDGKEYVKDIEHGGYKERPREISILDEAKLRKIEELKSYRDTEEVEPIEVNGHLFDYDDKARERINAAIIALDLTQGTITWTLADNTDTEVTATDLKYVVAIVAQRSNSLHIKYRQLKEQVLNAETVEEVESITW